MKTLKVHYEDGFYFTICGLWNGPTMKTFDATNWVVCQGPAVFAPHHIEMRGFQGFRYTEMIF